MSGWVREFDAFELDERSEELRCGGAPMALNHRPVQVLAYLLSHSERFVSKDELIREVWDGVVVIDSALGMTATAGRARGFLERDGAVAPERSFHR